MGVEQSFDKAFSLAKKAGLDGGDPGALYLLGLMCENAETPDQAEGGPRQEYDHYDAERFYELCAQKDSIWKATAISWLGDYYMDMARGGDPEVAIDYYTMIGHDDPDAAEALSDYYYDMVAYNIENDVYNEENGEKLYEWTLEAYRFNPHDYAYRMGRIYAEGIGCEPSFRLARKYYEDAYEFGVIDAADDIANLYQNRIDTNDLPADELARCRKEVESWHRIAERARARQSGE